VRTNSSNATNLDKSHPK